MHIGILIKQYRELNRLSMADFAKKANISKAYVSVLEKNKDPRNGKPIVPSIPTIQNVANGMGMSFDELFNLIGDDELVSLTPTLTLITETSAKLTEDRQLNVLDFAEEQFEQQEKVFDINEIRELYADYQTKLTEVDLYGLVSAGTGVDLYDEVLETITYPAPVPSHDIALRVVGDSMAPLFQNEEVIFIRKTMNINSGQIGVFIINGQGYVKKLYKGVDQVKLISLNEKYEDIVLSENDHVVTVGLVIF